MQPPNKPWKTGTQPEYTAFKLSVEVCQDSEGNLWSGHDFGSPADEEASQGLQHNGVPQVAQALLLEAVRREIFTSALVQISDIPDFLDHWKNGSEAEKTSLEHFFSAAIQKGLALTLGKLVPGAIPGVLGMLCQQGGLQEPDPE